MRALRRVDLAAAVYERAQWVQSYIQTDKLSRPLMELSDIPAVFRAHVPPLLKADAAGDAFVSMTRAAYADAALQSTPLDSLSLEHGKAFTSRLPESLDRLLQRCRTFVWSKSPNRQSRAIPNRARVLGSAQTHALWSSCSLAGPAACIP